MAFDLSINKGTGFYSERYHGVTCQMNKYEETKETNGSLTETHYNEET